MPTSGPNQHPVALRFEMSHLELEFLRCTGILFFIIILSGVRLSPLGTAATTSLLYQAQMIDDGDCGAIGGIKIDTGNRSTRRKREPTFCPPQIPHDLTWARTRAGAVGSQRLTA
jgi:hypothetical protein